MLIALLILLGLFAGFLSGLFGIGGGMVLVPIMLLLTDTFLQGEVVITVHSAVATAMTCIIFNSGFSAYKHYKSGNVKLNYAKTLVPGVMIGSFVSSYFLFESLKGRSLSMLFVFVVLIAILQIVIKPKASGIANKKSWLHSYLLGGAIFTGALGALVGAGGGFLAVPLVRATGCSVRESVSTGSLVSFPVSLLAVSSYLLNPPQVDLGDYFIGYIYTPILFYTLPASVLAVGYGVKSALAINQKLLSYLFASYLLIIVSYVSYRLINTM